MPPSLREEHEALKEIQAKLVADRDKWRAMVGSLIAERDSAHQPLPADIFRAFQMMEIWLDEWANAGNKEARKDLARLRAVMRKYRFHPTLVEAET